MFGQIKANNQQQRKIYAPPIFGSQRSLYQKLALLRFSAVQGVIACRKSKIGCNG
tara:strand:- start:921 stop:1085 length:165 start_codon:yes stop_codon:yes gene_type:complete